MMTDQEGSESDIGSDLAVDGSGCLNSMENLQYIIFDCSRESMLPVKGTLQVTSEPNHIEIDHEKVLRQYYPDASSIHVLKTEDTERLFGKKNVYFGAILRYAQLVFIRPEAKRDHYCLVYSDRQTRLWTASSQELVEDASDLMVLLSSPESTIEVIINALCSHYRTSVAIFHQKKRLLPCYILRDHVEANVSLLQVVFQIPVQIRIRHPLDYNILEVLLVECYSTDLIFEIKRKLVDQLPTKRFAYKDIRITVGDREINELEPVLMFLKTEKVENKTMIGQTHTFTLHTAPNSYKMIIVEHSTKRFPVFISEVWSTADLRNAVSKLTECYPQSLNIAQQISPDCRRELPETNNIGKFMTEETVFRTSVREIMRLEITALNLDQASMKYFVTQMYDLNTVDDLKDELSLQLNIEPFHLDIIHGKTVLSGSSTFKNLGFKKKENITVVLQRQRISVYISYAFESERRRQEMILDDPTVATVGDLLEFWAIELVCESTVLRLLFHNNCLDPGITLKNANVQNGSLLAIRHCSPAFDNVPGKFEKIIEEDDRGDMKALDAISMGGMAFYSNPNMDYTNNICSLKKQRSEERKARKLPSGMKLEVRTARNLTPITPARLFFPLQSMNCSFNADGTGICRGEISMTPARRINFDMEMSQPVADSGENKKLDVDALSCKTYPLEKSTKRPRSTLSLKSYGSKKRRRMANDILPKFELLSPGKDELDGPKYPQNKERRSIIQSDGLKTHDRILSTTSSDVHDSPSMSRKSNLVKQTSTSSKTEIYTVPGENVLIRREINTAVEDEWIHDVKFSEYRTPTLVEVGSRTRQIQNIIDCNSSKGTHCHSTGISGDKLHYISKKVLCNWKFLARELGLEETTISSIEIRHDWEVAEKLYQTLLKWKQKHGQEVNLEKLGQAFEAIDHREAADLVRELVEKSLQT